jgi:transposase
LEKLPRQVYTSEFREQAVELVIRKGLGLAEALRCLSLSPKTLTNWVRRARGGETPVAASTSGRETQASVCASGLSRREGRASNC